MNIFTNIKRKNESLKYLKILKIEGIKIFEIKL